MLRAVPLALLAWVTAALRQPPLLKVVPFTKIADEIYEAERAAQELEWKVGNSSEEKSSIQWFISTAMRELNQMKKESMNTTHNGSLANKWEACYNRTGARMPYWNASRTIKQNLQANKKLAPDTVEAHMYALYEAERKAEELTTQLGQCQAKCPVGLLAKLKAIRKVRAEEDPAAPAPAPGDAAAAGPPPKPSPRELMRSVADAIYNTSQSMTAMQELLKKDKSAKDVLQAITEVVTSKLLKAKKDMKAMEEDLEECMQTPETTHLGEHLEDAMAENKDISMDMINVAEAQASSAKKTVRDLEEKLSACKAKCEI